MKALFIEELKNPVCMFKLRNRQYHFNFCLESDGDNDIITATSTPLVGLLVQGSPSDIEHVCDLVKIKVPVVILKGTGAAADLFSFTIDEIKHR